MNQGWGERAAEDLRKRREELRELERKVHADFTLAHPDLLDRWIESTTVSIENLVGPNEARQFRYSQPPVREARTSRALTVMIRDSVLPPLLALLAELETKPGDVLAKEQAAAKRARQPRQTEIGLQADQVLQALKVIEQRACDEIEKAVRWTAVIVVLLTGVVGLVKVPGAWEDVEPIVSVIGITSATLLFVLGLGASAIRDRLVPWLAKPLTSRMRAVYDQNALLEALTAKRGASKPQ